MRPCRMAGPVTSPEAVESGPDDKRQKGIG